MSPQSELTHLPSSTRVDVFVFPLTVAVVVTFFLLRSLPLNTVSPSDSDLSVVQLECHFHVVADCVEKVVVQPESAANCCHAPDSKRPLVMHVLVTPLASGIVTPRAFMA